VLLVADKDARTSATQIELPITVPTSRAGRLQNILRLGALLRRLNRKTRFVYQTADQMLSAIAALDGISPELCRSHVVQQFSEYVMVESYLQLYRDTAN
jgi:hypothetical protein